MKNLKQRFESKELRLYKRLNVRSMLTAEDLVHLTYLEKGFEGEKKFDEWTSNLSNHWLFLDDMLFENNKTEFQVDSLGITGDTIHLFDVKNFEGDFFIEADSWYKVPHIFIKNPYEQLKRAESMLHRLLHEQRLHYRIEPHLVFVNPDFYLYQAPMNLPIIFPSQLKRFFNQLNLSNTKLNTNHLKLAETLLSLHKTESKYAQYPKYQYEDLKKGITCYFCHTFIYDIKNAKLVCHVCGSVEELRSGLIRMVDELQFLFPERKITTNAVYEWCQIYHSTKGIRLFLHDQYKMIGHGKYSFYV